VFHSAGMRHGKDHEVLRVTAGGYRSRKSADISMSPKKQIEADAGVFPHEDYHRENDNF